MKNNLPTCCLPKLSLALALLASPAAHAQARIEGSRVVGWSDLVAVPTMARYAWADNPADANLANKEALPVSTFTTE